MCASCFMCCRSTAIPRPIRLSPRKIMLQSGIKPDSIYERKIWEKGHDWALLLKVAQTIQNSTTVRIIVSLLINRRFYVEMDGKQRRWRNQKNGLPQRSMLAPVLLNTYVMTNQNSLTSGGSSLPCDPIGFLPKNPKLTDQSPNWSIHIL